MWVQGFQPRRPLFLFEDMRGQDALQMCSAPR
jgi:hypothetical protein